MDNINKPKKNMNRKIILTAIIVVIIASIFLFFKFFHKECVQLEITYTPDKPAQGQMVTFKSNAEEGENVVWNFGDTASSDKGIEVTHKYKQAGTFTIK